MADDDEKRRSVRNVPTRRRRRRRRVVVVSSSSFSTLSSSRLISCAATLAIKVRNFECHNAPTGHMTRSFSKPRGRLLRAPAVITSFSSYPLIYNVYREYRYTIF